MSELPVPTFTAIDELVDRYRNRCPWFLRRDYYPRTCAEQLRVLAYIERYGDLEAYRQAGKLKGWLLQTSSAPSAA